MTSRFNITGNYYNNHTSQQMKAELSVSDDRTVYLSVENEIILELVIDSIQVSDRIANTTRTFTFPDGSSFETEDNDTADQVLEHFNLEEKSRLIYFLETQKKYIISALLLLILSIGGGIFFGVPLFAKIAAFMVPPAGISLIGDEAIAILDRAAFSPTSLSNKTMMRLEKRFNRMILNIPESRDYRLKLLFRNGGALGANAFALPGGSIVLTDQLVRLSKNDNELVAILAHEIGHVVNRHGLRTIIQDSIISIVIITVTGDVLSTSSIAAAIPALLIKGGYSRDFEREADRFSYYYLKSNKIDKIHFISILKRLEKEHNMSGSSNLFSTHPGIEERIE